MSYKILHIPSGTISCATYSTNDLAKIYLHMIVNYHRTLVITEDGSFDIAGFKDGKIIRILPHELEIIDAINAN